MLFMTQNIIRTKKAIQKQKDIDIFKKQIERTYFEQAERPRARLQRYRP